MSLLLINKPRGITSHDVVDEVRRITGVKKVGHGGTLDPLAEGLLVVGVGREDTKKLGEITKNYPKTYQATIRLGATSTTDDKEGRITRLAAEPPSEEKIQETVNSFRGKIMQTPPAFSAIKLKGKKAYEVARKGEVPELKEREIAIYRIKILGYSRPFLKVETEVSGGTYIRALARDIGKKLDVGAYLENLKRIKIGRFSLENAVSLEALESRISGPTK